MLPEGSSPMTDVRLAKDLQVEPELEPQPIEPVDLRARRREVKRAQILAAAWTLAHREGLAGISLRDLAALVDLRQPSLYAYFESKHDLYDAMFAEGNRQLLDRVAEFELSRDPRTAAKEMVRLLVQFSTDDIVRYQLLFQRPIPGFEPSPASYALAMEFYEFGRLRMAAAGVSDPEDFDVFTALVAGLADQQVANDPGGDRWVRQSARVIDMFFADIDRRRKEDRRRAGQRRAQRTTTQGDSKGESS
jgi:AcrR family transcriptional regulator